MAFVANCERTRIHNWGFLLISDLEHLTIGGFKVSMVKSERFVDAFQFPRLKYLYIEADQDYTVIEYSISKVS